MQTRNVVKSIVGNKRKRLFQKYWDSLFYNGKKHMLFAVKKVYAYFFLHKRN